MTARVTTSQYIIKAKSIHKDRYDYSKVIYTIAHDFIKIICKIHGVFEQRAYCHVDNRKPQGCPKCAHNLPITIDEARKRSKKKYGEKYSIHNFSGIKRPMKIKCKDHGFFTIPVAETHWSGKDGGMSCLCKNKEDGRIKDGMY
jgi:hypothetical protein